MTMQAKINISIIIPHLIFKGLFSNPDVLLSLLGDEELHRLKAFLFDNLVDKDGSPEISAMRVHFFTYDEQTKTGGFRLKFNIERVFCCSDFGNCSEDYIDFKFEYVQDTLRAEASYFNWVLDN